MGTDKAWLAFGEETLLGRVVRLVGEVFEEVVVVAAAHQLLPKLPAEITILRDVGAPRGPLAGLQTGLRYLSARGFDHAFLCGADMPLLEPVLIERLVAQCGARRGVMLRVESAPQPLCAAYAADLLPVIDAKLAQGAGPLVLLNQPGVELIDAESMGLETARQCVQNINTLDDYLNTLERAGLEPDRELIAQLRQPTTRRSVQ